MSTSLSTELAAFGAQLDKMGDKLAATLPSHISLEAFKRTTLVALQQNPALLQASRRHVLLALQHAAGAGLLPDGREGAIVVRWNSAERAEIPVFQPMVQGLMKLGRQAGMKSFRAHVVYEGERFRIVLGDEDRIEHERNIDLVNIEKAVAVYAIAEMADGTIIRRHMTASKVKAIKQGVAFKKDGSKRNIPWNGPHEAAMWEKSGLINLSKWLPLSPERENDRRMLDAIDHDERLDGHSADIEHDDETPGTAAPADPALLTEEQRLDKLEAALAGEAVPAGERMDPPPDRPDTPMRTGAPDANPDLIVWVVNVEAKFAKVKTNKAMFALIDEIKTNRDWLRANKPDLAERISVAAKACADRLSDEVPA